MLDLRQMKNFCERPLIISRGEGIYCYDGNGKRYIEGVSGIYVTNIGHGNRQVIEAMRRQREKVGYRFWDQPAGDREVLPAQRP